jgi:ribosomal protein L11 methyltransferase
MRFMEYIEVEFKLLPFYPWNEVMVAYLSEMDFESFQENEPELLAYIQKPLFNLDCLNELIEKLKIQDNFSINFKVNSIQQQNWNAVWESQFEPVFVDEQLQILAPFHEKNIFLGETIFIEPKMSFGTGHHQTTFLMCKEMFELDFKMKKVLDMGAGTGVLAILAEKLGASEVFAFDIEPWSVENCADNALKNDCMNIQSKLGDIDSVEGSFDVILANINKNVLKSHMASYSKLLNPDGVLLLSGFFKTDADELIDFAASNSLSFIHLKDKEGWAMLKFKKD